MKFLNIYDKTIVLWPVQIDISDGRLFEDRPDSFYSKNLSMFWNLAQKKSRKDEWVSLMVWVIFGILHPKAHVQFKENEFILKTNNLNLDVLKADFLEALQVEGYEEMLKKYAG